MQGVLTVDKVSVTFDGSNDEGWIKYGTPTSDWVRQMWRANTLPYDTLEQASAVGGCMTNSIPLSTMSEYDGNGLITCRTTKYTSKYCYIFTPLEWGYELSDLKAMLAETPLQFVYPINEPIEIHLDPITVQTLIGDNVIWSDTNGQNTVTYKKKG